MVQITEGSYEEDISFVTVKWMPSLTKQKRFGKSVTTFTSKIIYTNIRTVNIGFRAKTKKKKKQSNPQIY